MFKDPSGEGGRNLASPGGLRSPSADLAAHESSWLGLLSVLSRPALSFLSKYVPGLGGGRGPELAQDRDLLLRRLDSWSWLDPGRLGIEPGRNSVGSPFARDAQSSRKDAVGWGDPPDAPLSHADPGLPRQRFRVPPGSKLTKEQCRAPAVAESAGTGVHKEGAPLSGGPADQDNGYYSLEEEHGQKRQAHLEPPRPTDAPDRAVRDGLSERMPAGRGPEDGTADEMAKGHACRSAAAHVRPPDWTDPRAHVSEGGPGERHVTADDGPRDGACRSAAAHAESPERTGLPEDDAVPDGARRSPDAHRRPPGGTDSPPRVTEGGPFDETGAVCTASPQCRNSGIAFIMGCPCSDDDRSDDDTFDGYDSSELWSDRSWSDEDEEAGGPADEEAARLLASLCRTDDPYNPQNFSARLQTGRASPRSSPAADASPSSSQDAWDESGGEAEDAESLLLLASLSPSDPYSLLNFQAPLSTGKARPPPPMAPGPPTVDAPAPPSSSAKKVRFSDVVEEIVIAWGADAAEEEDRRGPWEELARDRGRFLRRCREAELSLAYCLQPEHRRRAYRRINGHHAD